MTFISGDLGGMRNPDLAVGKLHMVGSVGMDISRPVRQGQSEVIRRPWKFPTPSDLDIAQKWRSSLERTLKAQDFEDMVLSDWSSERSMIKSKLHSTPSCWQKDPAA